MTLKNDKISSIEKKIETEAILGSLDEERFALLVNLCKKITDFGHDPTAGKDKRIDGIPVQFDNVDMFSAILRTSPSAFSSMFSC